MALRLLPASFLSSLLVITAVSTIPALSIITFSEIEHAEEAVASVRNDALQKVLLLGEIQTTITESTRRLLTALANMPDLRGTDRGRQTTILREVLAGNPDYLNLSITDTGGRVVASALLEPGVDLAARKHIREALAGGGFAAGEYIRGKVEGVPGFPFSQAIRDTRGKTIGAINAVYRLESYRAVFDDLRLPGETILGILDHEGRRLFFHPPKPTNPVGTLIKPEIWDGIRNGEDSGTLLMSGSDEISRFYTFRKLRLAADRNPYLYIVLAVPESFAVEKSRAILLRNLGLMGIVIFSMLAIVWTITRRAYRPLLIRIMHTVDGIRDGDLSVRTGVVTGNSELERVAQTLDGMASALESRAEERLRHEQALHESLEEKEILLREVHHRVKNNLQLITSLISLQKHDGRRSLDFIERLEGRIRAMAVVHELLYGATVTALVNLSVYVEKIAHQFAISDGIGRTGIHYIVENLPVPLDLAIPFGLILNELLTNACKYADRGQADAAVTVSARRIRDEVCLTVTDNGPGLPADFDPQQAEGLGMQLVLRLVQQIGGTVAWKNTPGTSCTVRFPVPSA